MRYPFGSGLAVVLGVAVVGGVASVGSPQAPPGDAAKSLEAQVAVLGDKKADVDKRIAACAALRKAGAKAQAALPALIEALNDTRSIPRQVTLTDRGPSTMRPPMPDQSTPEPVVIPINIATALEELNKGAGKGPGVTPTGPNKGPLGIEDRGLTLRRAALDVIAGLGPDTKAAIPALTGVLKTFADIRYQDTLGQQDRFLEKLVSVLGQYGPQAREATEPLIEVLNGTLQGKTGKRTCGFTCRMKALNALADIDPESPEFVAALTKLLASATKTTETEKKASLGLELAAVRQLGEVTAPTLLAEVQKALQEAKAARDPALQRAVRQAADKIEQRKGKGP
jgi:hypothetical protein